MELSRPLYQELYLMLFLLVIPAVHLQPAESCTEQINSCSCKTENGYINLEPLDEAKNSGQPR